MFKGAITLPRLLWIAICLYSLQTLLSRPSALICALCLLPLLLYGASQLLSRNSLPTSLSVDRLLSHLTYPQHITRDLFVLRQYKPFPANFNYSIVSGPIYRILDNILDKFVLSWHADITPSKAFPGMVRKELVHAVHQLYGRLKLVDKFTTLQYVLDIVCIRVQEVAHRTCPSFTQVRHVAAHDTRTKEQYIRAICDLLMRVVLSSRNYECEALRAVLREILSSQLFTPLVEKLSEPSFLYRVIIDILEDDGEISVSDDDKEFMRTKMRDRRCVEIVSDEHVQQERSTTIQFSTFESDQRGNHFRIPKVRLFGEGLNRFAVYVIEYSEKLCGEPGENAEDVPLHLVGRRFKEFSALHDRLLKSPETRGIVKKINFPSKESFSSFPFNRLDKDFLTSRKDLLTQYLNELSHFPTLLSSPHLKEFLGCNKDHITVFRTKSNSFAETKIGQNLSKVLKTISLTLSRTDKSGDGEGDDDFLDIGSERYPSYKETIRRTKKLTSLSRDHYNFLTAPPHADINELLTQHIKVQLEESGDEGEVFEMAPNYAPFSIAECSYAAALCNIGQQAFWQKGGLLAKPGFAQAASTLLRLPLNRYIVNKLNQLTSEVYWFVYLAKLNHVVFDEDEKEEEEVLTREEFIERVYKRFDYKALRFLEVRNAVEVLTEAISDKETNQAFMFLLLDSVLPMFVPELNEELKNLYR